MLSLLFFLYTHSLMARESCHFSINEALTLFANQGIEIGTKSFELKREKENISPACPPEYQEAMTNMFKKALTCQYVKSSPTDPRGEFVTFKDSDIGKLFLKLLINTNSMFHVKVFKSKLDILILMLLLFPDPITEKLQTMRLKAIN